MKVRYDGPGAHVLVLGYGRHDKGQVKEYPAEAAKDLIASNAHRHAFVIMDGPKDVESGETKAEAKAKAKKAKQG